jgi:hypothetical protein
MVGEIGGGVASGLATGGAAAVLGKGAELGLRGATALAAAEGGLAGLGASEAEDLRGMAKDAGTGALVGGAMGNLTGRVARRYIDTAADRHARHIAEEVTAGSNMTNKKRFAQIQALAPDVFDNDKPLRKALSDPEKGLDMVQERLSTTGAQTRPLYQAFDRVVPKMNVGQVVEKLDDAIEAASQEPGKAAWRNLLQKARDEFETATMYAARRANPQATADAVPVDTVTVRKWVSNLLHEADMSMGSLAETERFALKDRLHDVADGILKEHIAQGAAASPMAAGLSKKLSELNRKIAVLVKTEDALKPRAMKEAIGHKGLASTLKTIGIPGAAGLAAAGGDVITGGAVALGTSAAIAAGKALDKTATSALAKLAQRAANGSSAARHITEALKAGVPLASVRAVLSAYGRLPPGLQPAGSFPGPPTGDESP